MNIVIKRVVAKLGKSYMYMVETGEEGKDIGRVVDMDNNEIFPEIWMLSVLTKGYWNFIESDAEELRLRAVIQKYLDTNILSEIV
jgi:hypothetical protein